MVRFNIIDVCDFDTKELAEDYIRLEKQKQELKKWRVVQYN